MRNSVEIWNMFILTNKWICLKTVTQKKDDFSKQISNPYLNTWVCPQIIRWYFSTVWDLFPYLKTEFCLRGGYFKLCPTLTLIYTGKKEVSRKKKRVFSPKKWVPANRFYLFKKNFNIKNLPWLAWQFLFLHFGTETVFSPLPLIGLSFIFCTFSAMKQLSFCMNE